MRTRETLLCVCYLVASKEVLGKLPEYDQLPSGYDCVAVDNVHDVGALAQRLADIANDPAPAAAWLEGFLHQSGVVLLHDDRLWQAVDAWVASLSEENFTRILPLVRRTFALFPGNERQQLGTRAKQTSASISGVATAATAADEWNEARAMKPLGVLEQILGLAS